MSSYIVTLLANLNISFSTRDDSVASQQLLAMSFAPRRDRTDSNDGGDLTGNGTGVFSFVRSVIRTIREDLTLEPL